MMECVDGEYQNFKAKGGAYTREHFFGKYPELQEMVANMSDDDIWRLNRGGHDPHKVFNAYRAAMEHKGQPTVILAKTVKGFGMGKAGEGQNITHQQKKLDDDGAQGVPRPLQHPGVGRRHRAACRTTGRPRTARRSEYLQERRTALGGYLPQRRTAAPTLQVPALEAFAPLLESTGEREISTTMAFVRILGVLLKDKEIGPHVVPIVPDEARTFGMEGLFRQIGIYSSMGQLYTPQDADQLLYYREDKKGQILEEGINEGGAMCCWIAAGTAYANHGVSMVPFYIYYSMFGFQRVGDFIWAAGDMQSRGFLIGGTAGRTTLAGEGLQHQDGHSQLLATTVPNCVAYDPTYAYELAVIVQDGLRRMYAEQENVFYYVTCMNENYAHPAMPEGAEQGILKGMYLLQHRRARQGARQPARLRHDPARGARRGRAPREGLRRAGRRLQRHQLQRAAARGARRRALEPAAPGRAAARAVRARSASRATTGPFVAATDYMRTVPDQIRQWVPGRYHVLGTDGFGRSDSRAALRSFFEVDRRCIALAALKALADEGKLDRRDGAASAIERFGIDPDKPNPRDGLSGARHGKPHRSARPRPRRLQGRRGHRRAVQPGDAVAVDAPLVTLETEKATMDVPSTAAGVVRELKVQRGGRVSQGDLIALIEAAATGAPRAAPAAAAGTGRARRRCRRARRARRRRTPARRSPAAHRRRRSAAPARAASAAADAVVDEPGFSRCPCQPVGAALRARTRASTSAG